MEERLIPLSLNYNNFLFINDETDAHFWFSRWSDKKRLRSVNTDKTTITSRNSLVFVVLFPPAHSLTPLYEDNEFIFTLVGNNSVCIVFTGFKRADRKPLAIKSLSAGPTNAFQGTWRNKKYSNIRRLKHYKVHKVRR